MALEANKKELVLGTNVFNKPTELTGINAWAQLLVHLLFLRPGTYPSIPRMGVGIQDYEYDFMDAAVDKLNDEIPSQINTYLPDLPMESVKVSSVNVQGKQILLVAIQLYDNGTITTVAVAAEVNNRLINFDISWNN